MTLSKQERQRQTILHLWNEGIHNGHKINRLTNIPVSIVYDNIKKLKKNAFFIEFCGILYANYMAFITKFYDFLLLDYVAIYY